MTKKRIWTSIFLMFGAVVTLLGFLHYPNRAEEDHDHAIHAVVYNKTISLLAIDTIDDYKNRDEMISVYATLDDFEHVGIKRMALHLTDSNTSIVAFSYEPFSQLEVGKNYLFEGYIEEIDGENRFVVENIKYD